MNEDDLYEEIKHNRKSSCLIKLAALLTLLVFIVFSVPNLSMFFYGKLNFLNQNGILRKDEIVKLCKPSVVSILAEDAKGVKKQGTGFNISREGKIVTNQHVVNEAVIITVQFENGSKYYSKQYKSIPGEDIAIIEIKGNNLPTLALNVKEQVKTSDTVTIIGNPLGFEGISQRGEIGQFHSIDSSQVQAFDINIAIKPGSSGSPVLNNQAQVVGIVFASTNIDINGKWSSRALAIPIQGMSLK